MKTTKFNISDYLDNDELNAEYLNTVIKEGNSEDVKNAINNIKKDNLNQ